MTRAPAPPRAPRGRVLVVGDDTLVARIGLDVSSTPTATNAASLTTDSNAIASIMPLWCSVASTCRVPNRMVNTARMIAVSSAVSPPIASTSPRSPPTMLHAWASALNCRAIYGTEPMVAISVTSTARLCALP